MPLFVNNGAQIHRLSPTEKSTPENRKWARFNQAERDRQRGLEVATGTGIGGGVLGFCAPLRLFLRDPGLP